MVKLKGKPADMVVVQVYMPTTKHKEEEVDAVYVGIQEAKGKEYTLIMGDWNTVVEEKTIL